MKNPLNRYREYSDLFECEMRLFYCYAYVSTSVENVADIKRGWNQAHFIYETRTVTSCNPGLRKASTLAERQLPSLYWSNQNPSKKVNNNKNKFYSDSIVNDYI